MKKTYKVLDHGYVKYRSHMGDDHEIAMDARTSYDRRDNKGKNDRGLIRRLMRDRHTSPFEMGEVKFLMKMPLFVARQWVRHRTANMNEVSARYTQLPDEMFCPDAFNHQDKKNKQGRAEVHEDSEGFVVDTIFHNKEAYMKYDNMVVDGVSREQARIVLPLTVYTKFVWKNDLHNLLHLMKLRMDPHAQYECRVYANAVAKIVQDLFPLAYEAFDDYILNGYMCSRFEVDLIRYMLTRNGSFVSSMVSDLRTKYVDGGAMTENEWEQFTGKFGL
jgi:thymidylate synthase (FAD)